MADEADDLVSQTGGDVELAPPPAAAPARGVDLPAPTAPDFGSFDDVMSSVAKQMEGTDRLNTQVGENAALTRRAALKVMNTPTPQMGDLQALPLPPQEPQIRSPLQAFGSTAAALAALGGLLTRRPLTTSLKAAAGAMTALRQNDLDAFNRQYDIWRANTEYVEKVNNITVQKYNAAIQAHKGDQEGTLAAIRAIAAADQDQITANAAKTGDLRNVISIIEARSKLGQQFFDNNVKIAELKERIAHDKGMEDRLTGSGIAVAFRSWKDAFTAENGREPTEAEQSAKWTELQRTTATNKSGAAATFNDFVARQEAELGRKLSSTEYLQAQRDWDNRVTIARERNDAQGQRAADALALKRELGERALGFKDEQIQQTRWWREERQKLLDRNLDERAADRELRERLANMRDETQRRGQDLSAGRKPENVLLTKFLEENPKAAAADIATFMGKVALATSKGVDAAAFRAYMDEHPRATAQDLLDFSVAQKERPETPAQKSKRADAVATYDETASLIDDLIAKVDEGEKKRLGVTGVGGAIRRGVETAGNVLGITDDTLASDFDSQLATLRLKLPKLLTGSSKSAKDERAQVDKIARGVNWGDTPQKTKQSLLQLKDLLQGHRDAIADGHETLEESRPPGAPANAQQAANGKWYVPDPARPGKYLLWVP